MSNLQYLENRLFELRDEKYREFSSKLIPTVDKSRIIGVRTPELRKIAKELIKTGEAEGFLSALPHLYHEENMIHGFIISKSKDFDKTVSLLDKFLPFVDNWSTCDTISPAIFKKHTDKLYDHSVRWINSGETYTIRFGVDTLMTFYLDDAFDGKILDTVAEIVSDEYYVNMMRAWFFATALAKKRDASIPYIENRVLDRWTHNKSIQKAVESFRISDEDKEYLKSLRY